MKVVVSIIRIFFFSLWSVFCILLSMLICLLTLSKSPTLYFAKNLWAPIALPLMGAKLNVTGVENLKSVNTYIVMSNHCSYLDIPALLIAFPVYLYFIAKKELRRMPFLGLFLRLSGMIFIDRKNTAAAKESLAAAALLVQKGKHVLVFPEGTTSKTGEVNSFKKGGFHLAQDAQVPIIPVLVTGTYQIWPSAAKLKMKRGTITVKIGKPILPEDYNKFELNQRIEFVRQTIINL